MDDKVYVTGTACYWHTADRGATVCGACGQEIYFTSAKQQERERDAAFWRGAHKATLWAIAMEIVLVILAMMAYRANAAPPMREPFAVAPSQPGAERVEVAWYLAPARTCARGYKKPTVCVDDGDPLRGHNVRYTPAEAPVVVYALGFNRGDYVRVFVRSWYAGDAMPGYGGAPLSVLVYPQRGERVQWRVSRQATCAGCQ